MAKKKEEIGYLDSQPKQTRKKNVKPLFRKLDNNPAGFEMFEAYKRLYNEWADFLEGEWLENTLPYSRASGYYFIQYELRNEPDIFFIEYRDGEAFVDGHPIEARYHIWSNKIPVLKRMNTDHDMHMCEEKS